MLVEKMMVRLMVLLFPLCSLVSFPAYSDEPPDRLIAVANLETASMLAPLSLADGLLVLVQTPNEPPHVIDSRAWAMRDAKHFVFDSRCETSIEALYRERLQSQGVRTIDLNDHSRPRHWQGVAPMNPLRRDTLLAVLNRFE